MSKNRNSIEDYITIKDQILKQDRWCVFLIFLGMLAIGVFTWEVQQIENLSVKKESPKRELQADSQSY